ncbi:hypothetical protein ACJX0J_029955, partial [Zea mays]
YQVCKKTFPSKAHIMMLAIYILLLQHYHLFERRRRMTLPLTFTFEILFVLC